MIMIEDALVDNKSKTLLRTGRILVLVSSGLSLIITVLAIILIFSFLRSGQSVTIYNPDSQQQVEEEFNLLTDRIQVFKQQLQEIPRDEIAPEPLLPLLNGEQEESLRSIFGQIEEIEQLSSEVFLEEEDVSDPNFDQRRIEEKFNVLMERIRVFEQQLQDIPQDEVAPESLIPLLYGEQYESLDSIFNQIEGIEQMILGILFEEGDISESGKRPSLFPVLAISFLAITNLIICLALLVVLMMIGKKASSLIEMDSKVKIGSRTEQDKKVTDSAISPSPVPQVRSLERTLAKEKRVSSTTDSRPDPLAVFIGKDSAENILGSMYQAVYAYENRLTDIEVGYVINILGQFLDRFQNRYGLRPIGEPGEGPVGYNPQRHVCWEFARKGDPVWIIQPGWMQGTDVYAKALVSKEKRPILS
jgi:hypothetical protein